MKWLLWILRGRPMVNYTGYHCGLCGKWHNKEFDMPDYQDDFFSGWGLCPEGQGCRKCNNCEQCG